MDNRAIGIYDSGFGGLSVWGAVRERLPRESLLYFGDGLNCPYGLKPRAEVRRYAEEVASELLARGCKMIVVACNTATAAAIDALREQYPEIPIVGMEPAVKPACLQTRSGVVGVLATQRSLEGDLFQRTAAKYGNNVRVIARFGRGFVELVENNKEQTAEAEKVVREVVEEMVSEGVDQIVLGCTHYPFLGDVIAKVAPDVNIIDPSPAVAKQVEKLLSERNMLAQEGNIPSYEFGSFADESYVTKLMSKANQLIDRFKNVKE
ncbi:MAG: glutamate racemase [Rikenellaceae bacterium]